MIRETYEKICRKENLRENLIQLKSELKEEKHQAQLRKLTGGHMDAVMKCLAEEDPKIRKNAAAILGLMGDPESLDVLMDAYEEEDKRFVRPEYINAMANLDCEEYLPVFRKRLEELRAYDAEENEKKHIKEEMRALQNLLIRKEGVKKHTFRGYQRLNEVVLLTLPAFRDALAAKIPYQKTLLGAGVHTSCSDLEELLSLRLWQDMLFVIHGVSKLPLRADAIAEALAASNLMQILQENHKGESPFYFRVGIAGSMDTEQKSVLARQTADAIEEAFGHQLVNSVSHYEAEIRLILGKDGCLTPFLKLFTIPDQRFAYRRYHVASSMKPVVAAGLMELAAPYLKEYAQVLDPFCGVGTLLLERRFAGPVRNLYGIDTFGEAIEKARANTKTAGLTANYVNRNYFDFSHEYLFDEIITDMPAGNLSREELDGIYRRFFEKSLELLADHGHIIMFSNQMGLVKKYLRLRKEYRLLKEIEIQKKAGSFLFVLERV